MHFPLKSVLFFSAEAVSCIVIKVLPSPGIFSQIKLLRIKNMSISYVFELFS